MKKLILHLFSLLVIILVVPSCDLDQVLMEFDETHEKTNPFDPEYEGAKGIIYGRAALDQQPLTDDIILELRFSNEVPDTLLQIRYRNKLPDDWNSTSLPHGPSMTSTTESGEFRFEGVPVGTYILRASRIGYNSAWVSNIVVTENARVRLEEPILLTEQIEGKILFLSNRDGFTEFYRMNSDGTEQERLTFNGIIGWRDDDIKFSNIDFDAATNQAVFLYDEKITVFDNKNKNVIETEKSGNDVCWGPNGSIYYSDSEGIWKLSSITDNNPDPIYKSVSDGIPYIDVSDDGKIVFIESAYMYLLPDESLLYSPDGFSEVVKLNLEGNVLESDPTEASNLPFLIPVEQIKIMENDNDQNPKVQYSSILNTFQNPALPFHESGEIIDYQWNWYDGTTAVVIVDDESGDTSAYSYNEEMLKQNFERIFSLWGIEWSPDGEKLAFCDLFGSYMGYDYTMLELNLDNVDIWDQFDYSNPSTYNVNRSPDYSQEWSYWFNVSTVVYEPDPPDYIGDEYNYDYVYDSLVNFGVAQPIWSTDGSKIAFIKGQPRDQEFNRLDNTFAWKDLDIWTMDSDNSGGLGPQKQLTFDPNKDFSPIWIPAP